MKKSKESKKEVLEEKKEMKKDGCPVCGNSLEAYVVSNGVMFCCDVCVAKSLK